MRQPSSHAAWHRIESLVDQCLDLSGDQRAAFLVRHCGDDPELMEQVLDLLFASDEAQEFATPVWTPQRPAGASQEAADPPLAGPSFHRPGGNLEPFRIVRRLGQGGMGIVYLAEQLQPVRRQVALKVARSPLEGEGHARLAAERQAMARLSHPNIAQILEAGSTDDGHPFFAMELIDGPPITTYSDRHRLDVDARLRLFLKVCSGMQHAHQKGILHRDLKPSNVLVSETLGRPTPKIIDFGIAKIMPLEQDGGASLTSSLLVGTPAYMSPETLHADPRTGPDTRGDVYSLGVLLHELLIGEWPLAALTDETPLAYLQRLAAQKGSGLGRSWRRLTPSRRRDRAATRSSDASTLGRRLNGDLDWIVDKAIAHEVAERYASVSELAADVERHLADQPVLAGPPSTLYRLRKLVRRNRLTVLFTALLLATLCAGFLARSLEARRANREAREATVARDENARMLEFLLDLFRASDPVQHGGQELSARDILGQGSERLESGELDASPRVRARLLGEIAEVHWALGDPEEALRLAELALELNVDLFGLEHPESAGGLHLVGTLASEVGDYPRSERVLRRALELRQEVLGSGSLKVADTLGNLGAIHEETSRYPEALAFYLRALAIQQAQPGPPSVKEAGTHNNLGILYRRLDRLDDAEASHRLALSIRRSALGEKHPAVAVSWRNLGDVLGNAGRYDEAEAGHRNALALLEEVLGPEHPQVGHTVNSLGNLWKGRGRWQEAEAAYLRVQKIYTHAMGAKHVWIAYPLTNLGNLYTDLGRFEEAEGFHRKALALRQADGTDALATATSQLGLGISLRAGTKLDEAEPLLRSALDLLDGYTGGEFHLRLCLVELGVWALENNFLDEAERLLERARTLAQPYPEPDDALGPALLAQARLAQIRGQHAEALRLARQAVGLLEGLPPGHWRLQQGDRFLTAFRLAASGG